ncbi:DUF1080 domain-containing protein [Pontibacter brevis]
MTYMRKAYTFLVLFATVFITYACASKSGSNSAQADNTLTKKEQSEGWLLLFDGESMAHWKGFQKQDVPDAWQVQDGAIALVGKGGGDVITRNQYQNFELMLDWKISEGGNSGIFFNVSEDSKFKYTFQSGPEVQIIDDERHADAKQGKNGNRRAGTNYDLHPLFEPAVKPAGEYNTVRLVVNNGNVEQYLNGKKVVEYTLWSPEWERMVQESKFVSMPDYGRYKSGHIALQDHGDKVWFKNIKIRPL